MAVQSLDQIKEWVNLIIGKEVLVEVNKGRKKTIVRKGVVENTYPFFFTLRVDVDGSCQRISFNYVDILTKTVELEIL
ncbi:MAG: Veg family protein [Candidatus Atribacteria bacterium]|nr:Veg family protein [Candidatus Atribacteria bacterium]